MVATKRERLGSRNVEFQFKHISEACLQTLRVLVIEGENDPMEVDILGYNSAFIAAGNHLTSSLPWLLSQEEYHLDFSYMNPNGITAAAYIVTRDDFSPELLTPLLHSGLGIDAVCVKCWYFGHTRNCPKVEGG